MPPKLVAALLGCLAASAVPVASTAGAGTAPPREPTCTTDASASSERRELVVWHQLGFLAEEQFERFVTEFEAANPAIDIVPENLDEQGGMLQGLRSDRTPPDIVIMNQESMINLTDSGRVTPAQACVDADPSFDLGDLLPAIVEVNSIGEVMWGLPVFTSTPVIYFDQAQFRAAGLDPTTPPQTLDELAAQLEALLATGQITRGLVTASAEWFITAWAADAGVELAPSSGRVPLGPDALDLLQPELLERLDGLLELGTRGLVDDVGNEQFEDLLRLTDPVNAAGMVAHTSGSMRVVYDLLADGRFDDSELGVFPFPLTSRGTVLGGPTSFMFASTPAQQSAAWAFMSYLAGTEVQAVVGTLGYAAARTSSLADPQLQAAWEASPGLRVPTEVVRAIDVSTPGTVGLASGPEYRVVWRLGWAARDVIDGSPPADALGRALIDIDSGLAAYHRARAQAAAP